MSLEKDHWRLTRDQTQGKWTEFASCCGAQAIGFGVAARRVCMGKRCMYIRHWLPEPSKNKSVTVLDCQVAKRNVRLNRHPKRIRFREFDELPRRLNAISTWSQS